MKFQTYPVGIRLLISIIYIFPLMLDIYRPDYYGELGWLLLFILPFISAYYFGLKGGLPYVLFSFLIFVANKFAEYKMGLFGQWDGLVVPLVLGINLIIFVGAGLSSNKFKRQKHELELANRHLEIQQSQINEMFNNLDTTFWNVDLNTNETRRSAGLEKLTGYSHQDFQEDPNIWTAFVHPEDLGIAKEHYGDISNGKSRETQYRIISRNGQIKWIENRGKPVFDSENNVVKTMGVIFDITESKNSEAKYRLMAENVTDLVGIIDPSGIFEYISPSHEKVLGYDPKECIGTTPFIYMHPDDAESVRRKYFKMIDKKSPQTFVFRYSNADGNATYIESRATPVLESSGEVKNVVFVGRDITEKMEAEKSVKDSFEQYIRLQTSLDHFSQDLFGVMKVPELEKRVVKEVMEVLDNHSVCIVEVGRNLHTRNKCGNMSPMLLRKMITHYDQTVPICEVIETKKGCMIKIADATDMDYVLVIGDRPTLLRPERVWLKTLTRYVNQLYDNFKVIEDLSVELKQMNSNSKQVTPAWLSRLMFNLSENERKRLSQDLHDTALQEQILWYHKLENLSNNSGISENLRQELFEISEGLLDVIYQIRTACNELRPPMLKEFGLVASLESLFESTQRKAEYEIIFDSTDFHAALNDEQLIGLYRIIQELLANATKHSKADIVWLTLSSQSDLVKLIYRDNGIGMKDNPDETSGGMGIYGMKERVRSLEGNIEIESLAVHGICIHVSIPVSTHQSNVDIQHDFSI